MKIQIKPKIATRTDQGFACPEAFAMLIRFHLPKSILAQYYHASPNSANFSGK